MIVALVPTYGRRPELLENCLACFESQTVDDCRLLMLDDLGNVSPQRGPKWEIISTRERFPSITAKYAALTELALQRWDVSHFAIWDDDDAYHPRHLHAALAAMRATGAGWSYPEHILSAYHEPPALEPTGGRFWASIVFTRELHDRVGGFVQTRAPTFDQQFLQRLGEAEEPARPLEVTYCYRWQSTRAAHASGYMTRDNGDEWYDRCKPGYVAPIGRLIPARDEQTREIYGAGVG